MNDAYNTVMSTTAYVMAANALANSAPGRTATQCEIILVMALLGLLVIGLLTLIIVLFHDSLALFFNLIKHKGSRFICHLRARFCPRSFKKHEVQIVASSGGFVKCVERLIRSFTGDYHIALSERHTEIKKRLQYLCRCRDLITNPQATEGISHVSKEFAIIIRNRITNEEFRNAYFMDTPDYVLMRLDPFWEELVEDALRKSPLLSAIAGNGVDNLRADGPNNTCTGTNNCHNNDSIHGSSASFGNR